MLDGPTLLPSLAYVCYATWLTGACAHVRMVDGPTLLLSSSMRSLNTSRSLGSSACDALEFVKSDCRHGSVHHTYQESRTLSLCEPMRRPQQALTKEAAVAWWLAPVAWWLARAPRRPHERLQLPTGGTRAQLSRPRACRRTRRCAARRAAWRGRARAGRAGSCRAGARARAACSPAGAAARHGGSTCATHVASAVTGTACRRRE